LATAGRLRLAYRRPIGGVADAQPLEISAAAGGAARDLYVAASESGRVTAVAAATGAVLWRTELGVTHTTCPQLPGGTFGITGSPTYDAVRHAVFVAAANHLVALDVRTGAVLPGWPVTLPLNPAREHVWGALAQRGATVYATTASFCDRPPYKGRVIGVDVDTKALTEWDAVPIPGPDGGGGIWGWGGASIDPATGNLWVATGNSIDVGGEAVDDAESVVELGPDLHRIQGSHAPGVPGSGDYDFGATPLLFRSTSCGPLVAALNKNGSLYLWSRTDLRLLRQRMQLAFPAGLYGIPAWDPRTQTLFVSTTQGYRGVPAGLSALRLRGCHLRRVWTRALGGTLSSAPTVANDVVLVATGLGRLRAYRTSDGRRLADLPIGSPAFTAPIAVGGDVAVTTWGRRQLVVFRLSNHR
jgi:outer membrane protein assembly factor BamB